MSRQEQEELSFKDESSICNSVDDSEGNDAKDDFQLGVRYPHIVQVDELCIIPLTARFDILQAEEQMETECSLFIEVSKATLHQDTKLMVSNKVFCLPPSQDEEKMETGPEGSLSDTAETVVYYFYVFFF